MKNITGNLLLDEYLTFLRKCKKDKHYFVNCEYTNKDYLIKLGNQLLDSNLYMRIYIGHGIYNTFHIIGFYPQTLKFKIDDHTIFQQLFIFKQHRRSQKIMEFGTFILYFLDHPFMILTEDNNKIKGFYNKI